MPDLFGWYTPPAAATPMDNYQWSDNLRRDDPYAWEALLKNAGLWEGFTSAPRERTTGAQARAEMGPREADWARLAGYQIGTQDAGGTVYEALRDPSGNIVGQNSYQDGEITWKDALKGAAYVAALHTGLPLAFEGATLGAEALGTMGSLPAVPAQVPPLAPMGTATMPTIGEVASIGGTAAGASALPAGAAAGTGVQTIGVTAPAWGSGIGTLPASVGESLGTVASISTNAAAGITPMAGGSSFGWDSILKSLANGGARSLFDIGSGLYGMSLARDAAKASDPFAQYRGFYGEQLQQLEQNPSSITSRPGWRAGLEGMDRQMAARGYYGSGNMDAARTRYAGDFYQQESARLAQLAGAGQTPGAGQISAAQLTGQGLASIGYGLAPWIGGPAGPTQPGQVQPLPIPTWGRP